jgi:WXG100 family type VII secretion target
MSTVALERADTYIEDLLDWIPSEGRGFVRGLLNPVVQLLYEVSGDPDDLMRGAQVWADQVGQVREVGSEISQDVSQVVATWEGQASEAFQAAMTEIVEAIENLAEAVKGTSDLLVEAANAAVEAFNLILQLIAEVLILVGTELILALAAAIFSFGATVAAWMASTAAKIPIYGGRIGRVVARLASILTKLARVLEKIASMLKSYAQLLLKIRKAKGQYGLFKKARYSKEGLKFILFRTAVVTPGRLGFNFLSPVDIEGAGGLAQDGYSGYQDLQDGSVDDGVLLDNPGGGGR